MVWAIVIDPLPELIHVDKKPATIGQHGDPIDEIE
jgi:hypothetical protein